MDTINTEDFVKVIPLGDFSKLLKTPAKDSPYSRLYNMVVSELGGFPRGRLLDVTKVWITSEDNETLLKLTKDWLTKHHTKDARLSNEELNWLILEMPASFQKGSDPTWAKNGHVYIKKDLFIKPTEDHDTW